MVQPITIAPYDLEWPAIYAAERDRLATACSALPIRIGHIGSTSVPGLGAKPIVDIMVGLHPSADLDASIEPITSLGYRYIARYQEGDHWMPFRRYFNQRSDGLYGSSKECCCGSGCGRRFAESSLATARS